LQDDSDPDQSGGGWIIKKLRQTYLSDDELAAAPQYVNDNAYTTLAQRVRTPTPF